MRVVGDRLYCATGVDRAAAGDKGETATFCLDADNGKLLWKTPAPFAVWSKPVVKDGLIHVTSGNGDVFDDAKPPEKPGGALQCLDQQTGTEKWRFKVDNGIIEAPAVDAHRVYFGSRDWNVYCLDRQNGKEVWKYFMQAPVIATPVLDSDPVYGRTLSVFVITSQGKVCCMNPRSGDIVWTFMPNEPAYASAAPRLVVTPTADGYRRQLYFGCGLGGGTADYGANRPIFYCLEDQVIVK
jgi:outer membrane protein assembly factor BamB